MRRPLCLASALALGLAGVAHAASDLAFYAAKSTLLSTGSTTTDASTALVSGPAVVVTSGSKVSLLSAQIVLQVISPVADGGSFDLACTSGTTGSIGSASRVTVTSKTTSPVATSNQYTLASASSTNPVTISFPSLTAGSACASGLVCGAGTTAVTITCAVSATSGTTLPSALTAGTYAFAVDVVDPIPAGVDATLTCAAAADVTGAYLSSAKTTPTDVATATVTAIPLVLSIIPGTSAVRGDTGASFLTNQKLTTNDSVLAIEGSAYGAGGLFMVVLDQGAPEALTVTCLVDSTMSGILANSTTRTDYTVSIASGSGTSASTITLPAVQSISTATNVLLTCTAANAAGRVYSTASTYVAATPLKLVVTAKNGVNKSINTDGTYTTFTADTDLTSTNNQVVRIEGQADSAGGTVTIKANSAPTAAVTITCTPNDMTVITGVTVASTISTATAVNLTIGTVADISAQKSVTVTCAPSSASGGLSTTDSVTFTVLADPLKFVLYAQAAANKSIASTNVLTTYGSATAVPAAIGGTSNGTVIVLEGSADTPGSTLKVALNAPSGGSNNLTCKASDATKFVSSTVPTVAAVTDTTQVAVDLKTVADIDTAATVTVTCTVNTAANHLSTSDGFSFNLVAQPLGFIVTAQSGAIKSVASTNVLVPFGSATALTAVKGGSSNDTVYLLEGQADADAAAGAVLLTAVAANSSFTTTLTVTQVGSGSSAAGTKQTVVAASPTAFQQDQVALSGTFVATDTVAVEVVTTTAKTTVTYTANSTDGLTLADVATGVKSALASPLAGATIATDNVIVLTATAAGKEIGGSTSYTGGYAVFFARVGTGSSAAVGNVTLVPNSSGVSQVDAIALSGTFAASDTIEFVTDYSVSVRTTYTVNSVDGTTVANVTTGLLNALSSPLGSGGSASATSGVLTITLGTGLSVSFAVTNNNSSTLTVTGTGPFTFTDYLSLNDYVTVTVKSTATGTPTLYTIEYTNNISNPSMDGSAVAAAVAAALTTTLGGTATASTGNAFTITAAAVNTALPAYTVTSSGTETAKSGNVALDPATGVQAVNVVYIGGTFAANDTLTIAYPTSAAASTKVVFAITSTNGATSVTSLVSALSNPLGGVTAAFVGGTVQVQLNGNSGGTNQMLCTTATASDFSNSLVPSVIPVSTTTNVAVNFHTVADLSTAKTITVTCTVAATGNHLTTSDGFSLDVVLQPLGFIVTAQSGAISGVASTNVLTTFRTATAITAAISGTSNTTLYLLEGQADTPGNTIKVSLNGASGGTNALACTTATVSNFTSNIVPTVANVTDTTPVNMDMKTVADLSFPISITLTCAVNTSGNHLTVSDGFQLNLTLEPLGFIVYAQSAAYKSVDSTGNLTAYGANTAIVSTIGSTSLGQVVVVEGQADAGGSVLQVQLNGNSGGANALTCTESGTSDFSATPTVASVTTTTPVDVTLNTPSSITTSKTVTLTCKVMTAANHLTTSDGFSVSIVIQPMQILVVAGSSTSLTNGSSLSSGTIVPSTVKIVDKEYLTPTMGSLFAVKLNGANAGASISISCTSGNTINLPNSATSTDYTKSFGTSGSTTSQNLTLGTAYPSVADGDIVLLKVSGNTTSVWAPNNPTMSTDFGNVSQEGGDSVTLKFQNGSASTSLTGGSVVSCTAYIDSAFSMEASSAFTVAETTSDTFTFATTTNASGSTANDIAAQGTLAQATTIEIQNVGMQTRFYVKCTTNDSTNGWPSIKTAFILDVTPQMQAIAGSAAYRSTMPTAQITVGTVLDTSSCLTPRIFEGEDTAAGAIATLSFGNSATATIICTSGTTTALASPAAVAVSAVASAPIAFSAPAAITSAVTMTVTCTVASSPAPTGVSAGQTVSFQLTIMPRSVSALVQASTLTRWSDGTLFASGTSVGYSTAGSTSMTPVLYEGSASTGQIGLQLNYAPAGTVSFSCSSSNSTIAPAVAAFNITDTSVTTFTIPPVTGISADTTVTYTCSPVTSAGGFVFTGSVPSRYTVKFNVYVMHAELTPVPAFATVLNGNGTAFGSTSTDLTSSTYNAALAVQVFEGAGSDSSKVKLQQNVAPGATGTVKCTSSNSNIMADIASVSITNDTAADAITLPAPANMGTANVQVSYTCAPTAAFGNLTTTDSVMFWVNVVAINVQAAAASSQTLSDGTTLAADTALPSGKAFVLYESQSTGLGTTVELLANTTPATNGTTATVRYACTSNNSSVIGTVSDVTLSSTKAAITLPTPGSVKADTDVIVTCTPKTSAGGLTTSESVAFTVHVKAIVVAAYSGTAQTAADGKTAMTTSTMLVSGKASATPQIVELAVANSISNVVALQANATPTATITYSCMSSNTSVLDSVPLVQVNSTTAVPVGLPQSGQIDKTTTVTYTCVPTASAGGVTTSDTFTFDVTVVPLAVSAQAGTAAMTATGAMLAQGTALASGNAAKTPSVVTTVTPAAGALVQLVANGTPSAAVSYKCASSNSTILAGVTASVSSTIAVGLTFGAAGDVSTATTVTFTCAPTANAGGLTTADSFTFDVTVLPRTVDVYPSTALTAADGYTMLSTSTKISGGGSLAKTVQLYAGVTYAAGSTVALKVNVAPTTAVSYMCMSSDKAILGDVAATSVSTTTAVNLVLPTPAVVLAGTLVTFTCAPSATAGGFATTVSVTFDVFVSDPTAQVVAGSAAGTAADGTTTLTAGATILGAGIASRTPVVFEGAAASSTIVALQATAAPQTPTTYSCKSSNSTVLADIDNVSLSAATVVGITIPVASSIAADTTVTYTCTPSSVAAPTFAPTPAATMSGTTQAITPASTTALARTISAGGKTTVTGTVFFDIKVKALKPVIKAGSSAVRADTNLALATGTDISGGGSLAITPAVMYGQSTTAGAVATISLNAAATAAVTFSCTSSATTVLANIVGLSVSGTMAANIQIPTPMGTETGDTTVTYTCAPTAAAGGLDPTDSVKFDVYVYYYGLMAVAGSSALNSSTLLSISAGTNIGYSTTAPLAPLLVMYAGRSEVVTLRTKTPALDSSKNEVAVDVYCASNNTAVMTDVTVSGLLNAGTALSLPNPAAVSKNTTVTYTCSVVCASSPYKGNESVKFDVVVLARALVAVAGSSATTASGSTVASGTLLTSGSASLTPAVFELQSSTSGALVKLYTTVPPTATVSVTCTSSDTATLPNVTSTLSMSTTSNVVGGTAVSVTIPTSLTIGADKTVTYTCMPSSSAGGYTTEAIEFEVYVRNQKVVFVTGTKAIATDSKGNALMAGSQVTSIQAIEQTRYAAGELVNLEALNQPVTVDCTLTNDKDSPAYTGSVLAASTATTPDIAVTTSPTAVYLSAMPSVTGAATTLVLSCSPKTAGSGYQTSDVFSMNIVINDLFPNPAPMASGTPRVKFTVTLAFKTQPSSVQLAAIEAQIQSTVASKLGVPASSVVVTASTSRRALLDVSAVAEGSCMLLSVELKSLILMSVPAGGGEPQRGRGCCHQRSSPEARDGGRGRLGAGHLHPVGPHRHGVRRHLGPVPARGPVRGGVCRDGPRPRLHPGPQHPDAIVVVHAHVHARADEEVQRLHGGDGQRAPGAAHAAGCAPLRLPQRRAKGAPTLQAGWHPRWSPPGATWHLQTFGLAAWHHRARPAQTSRLVA